MQFFTQASTGTAFPIDPLTIVMLLALAVLIFFMFRNSRKRKEQMAELQSKMVPGARVMTNFGLFGELISVDEDKNEALIEIAPGTSVVVHRQVLSRVVDDEPANDTTDPTNESGTDNAGDPPVIEPR